ncbi:TMEM175 family protein [Paraburkholderia jirisanensis]
MIKTDDGLARFYALSDGIFAVIITIMVLAFKPPGGHDLPALMSLWPDLLSYAVSYAFVAVVWLNHHAVLRHAQRLTATLALANFANLFAISFIPFTTAWLAETELASFPLTFYALVFLLVQATYMVLMRESYSHVRTSGDDAHARHWQWVRAWIMLAVFLVAAVVVVIPPFLRLALLASFLILYCRPDPFLRARSGQHN